MRIASLIVALSGLVACTTTGSQPQSDRQMMTVQFALVHNGRPVDCTTPLAALGSASTAAWLRDARFYVRDIALIDSGGEAVPLTLGAKDRSGASLIDLENGTNHCAGGTSAVATSISGSVPDAFYTGIRFTIGTQDQTLAERGFLKIDIDPAGGVRKSDGSSAATWSLLLAAGDCQAGQCQRPNQIPVTLTGFHPAHQAIGLDLDALFAASNLTRDQGGAVGCASDPNDRECAPIFRQLGLSLPNGAMLTQDSPSIFRAIAKNSR